jgi:hypothetical protein
MSIASGFNATVEFLTQRPAWQLKLAGLVLSIVLACAFLNHWENSWRDDGAQTVRDSLSASTALRLHHQKDAIAARIDTQTVTLTKTLHRVDTLWADLPLDPVTHLDSVRVFDALPVLRRATDSAIASCSEFQISCAEYRRVADSLDIARQMQIAALNARIAALTPSPPRRWLTWLEIGGAAYVGYRVGHR